ncbi:hypothetical protein LZC95_25595 [Pendulispora brunnea]|uniref:Uncharacterized protein n=1 Tax=Pendulispora brunnea TaxID=2905690 RepID=A0ABZ2KSZ5_9BACT
MRLLVVSCAFLFSAVVASQAQAETLASGQAHPVAAASSTRGHRSKKAKRPAKNPERATAGAVKATAAPAPFQPPAASMSRPVEEPPAPAAAPSPPKAALPRLPAAHGKRVRKSKTTRPAHGTAKSI